MTLFCTSQIIRPFPRIKKKIQPKLTINYGMLNISTINPLGKMNRRRSFVSKVNEFVNRVCVFTKIDVTEKGVCRICSWSWLLHTSTHSGSLRNTQLEMFQVTLLECKMRLNNNIMKMLGLSLVDIENTYPPLVAGR